MRRLGRLVLWAGLYLAGALPVTAAPSGFDWSGQVRFDASAPVPGSGSTLGALMSELFGADAADGQVRVQGTIGYDTATPAASTNHVAGAFRGAITSASVTVGSVTLSADLPRISAHAAASRVGMLTLPGGGFCGDAEHCEMLGLRAPGWGNQVGLLNDTGHGLIDETGVTPELGDALFFMLGRTSVIGEFTPALETKGFGIVGVDGLTVGFLNAPGRDINTSVTLPPISVLHDRSVIGRTEIWLFLESTLAPGVLRLEGFVTGLNLHP